MIKVSRFVIDGLNELETIIIGENSFYLDKMSRFGSKCLIMNCAQLSEIHIGYRSFCWCESFELKNLSSLISIQLDDFSFCLCRSIVFEGMNEWLSDEWDLTRLQSITLRRIALCGDGDTTESNKLIMRSMSDNEWLIDEIFLLYLHLKDMVPISVI